MAGEQKLTANQTRALELLKESGGGGASTYWLAGNTPISTRTMYGALRGLKSRGLVDGGDRTHYWPHWRITDAGRHALQAADREGD